ncbi:mitochondrial ribosome-associated GTPase 2 isoform X2 [Dipodomys spectabilis]|uniref:mitochondrial ribosome-associated GTPase 2 isoform X2 n=1 Tax=Dipodomys spectabilis TaxID=105255 RepID=UPI001C54155E|nr:mitochondrial ribosome-associated GTPase 2 isoform X2 [Dipodomys spectabilis]
MIPARLSSASLCPLLEGVAQWASCPWAGLKPGQLLPKQALSRPLSVGSVDHAKQPEPPGKKPLSEKKLKRYFVDQRRVFVRGGNGGSGASCFHSEPRKEFGGPDGGDGGNGGHVILRVDQQVKSLSSVLSQYRGFAGEDGGSNNCSGRGGAVLYVQVPVGTLVKEGREVVADLSSPGEEYIAALGGAGGKGNRFFLANDNRAPVTCTPGQPGQERVLSLELKTVAHAGMVGPALQLCAHPSSRRRWVPQRGQVLTAPSHLERKACRGFLSVHHLEAPRGDRPLRRPPAVSSGRHPRHHPRRPPKQGPGAQLPAAHRALPLPPVRGGSFSARAVDSG